MDTLKRCSAFSKSLVSYIYIFLGSYFARKTSKGYGKVKISILHGHCMGRGPSTVKVTQDNQINADDWLSGYSEIKN